MMNSLLIAVLLASSLTIGAALQCYHCSSLVSWDDCYKLLRKETCSIDIESCFITEVEIKVANKTNISYARGCAQNCDVKSNHHCKKPGITCNLVCCKGDLCNRKQNPTPTTRLPHVYATNGAVRVNDCYCVVICYVFYLIMVQAFSFS